MSDQTSTRDHFVTTATRLFADRGFYGASLANIADELGLTKQALIHHFATKEKLYGLVLEQIADRLMAATDTAPGGNADDRLLAFFDRFAAHALTHPQDIRLLMRELLDNKQRADEAARWYLEPFLRNLVVLISATPRWRDAPEPQALAFGYQMLGAVSYFVVSEPTLARIFGPAQFSETQDIFAGEFRRTLRTLLHG